MKIKSVMIAFLALSFVFPAAADAAVVGKCTNVEGKVDITSPGKAAKPAEIGTEVQVGDIIRSKSKSKCEITFADGNILRLAENTRLKITEYMFDRGTRHEILNLFRGKIQNIVQTLRGTAAPEKAGRYEIHTPTSVCGVRGTNFFTFHQSGISGAIFKEGTGYGYSINRPQEVRTIAPGQSMVVVNPNLPPVVKPATARELDQLQKDTAPAEKKSGGEKKDGDDRKTEAVAAKSDGGTKDDKKPDDKKADDRKADEAKKPEGEKAAPGDAPKTNAKADDQGKAPGNAVAKSDDSSRPAGNGRPAAGDSREPGGPPSGAPPRNDAAMLPGGGKPDAGDRGGPAPVGAPNGAPPVALLKTDNAFPPGGVRLDAGDRGAPAGPPVVMQQPLMPSPLPAQTFMPPPSPVLSPNITTLLPFLGPNVLPDTKTPVAPIPTSTFSGTPTTFTYSGIGSSTLNPIVVPFKPPICDQNGLPQGCIAVVTSSDGTSSIAFSEPAVPPPPPPDTSAPTPDMSAVIYGTGSVFTHTIDDAIFTGVIKADGSIDTVVGGTMTNPTTPADAAGGRLGQGTFTNGTSFAGYFMGVPANAGTARGLMRSIYVTSAGEAGFLYGPLVGSFLEGGDAFGGVGTATQEPKLGTTSIAPADLEGAMNASGWTFAQPHFGDITVGGISSPLSIAEGTAEGEVRGITLNDGTKIGVWGVITNGGTYQNLSGSPIIVGDVGDSGGTFFSGDTYHMLGNVQGYDTAEGLVSLFCKLDYLDRHYQGKIKADYVGYNAGGTGGFQSIMAGSAILTPLAWSANIDYDYNTSGLYTVDGTGIHRVGDVSGGLAGGLAAPWNGKTAFSSLGRYSPAHGQGPHLWTAPMYSYNYKIGSGVHETYDGGAFFGLLSGVWQDDKILDARVYATYVSPTGKAGILKGIVGGVYFPDVSMYQGTGEWTAVELGDGSIADIAAISTGNPHPNMTDTAGDLSMLGGSFGLAGSIVRPAASLAPTLYESRIYGTQGNQWGLWQTITGGTYGGAPSDTWYLGTDYHNAANTLVTGTETIGSQWSAKKILGETRGFAADITSSSAFTWVSVGETIGSFDATAASWQAAQIMVGIETNTFLNLAGTAAGQAALQQLKIPAIEVGKANLSGTYSGMGFMNVNMNNVTFFANSTGGPPRIWATNGVTGSYDSAYNSTYPGKTVPLSGNGLTANFNVKTWDTAGGKWLSTVTNGQGTYSGPGSMNGSPVGFRGAAAGTMSAGAITSGTAAGTAK